MKRVETARCPVQTPRRGVPILAKGSAPPVRIPSLWAESAPSPRCSYFALWRDETNSFARLVFLFSRAWEFQQQSNSAPERSRHPVRAFSLIAKQIGRSLLPQRVPQPLAFLQASVVQKRTSSRVTWVCVALVSGILKQVVRMDAVFSGEARDFFRGQRSLPAHVFSRSEWRRRVLPRKIV